MTSSNSTFEEVESIGFSRSSSDSHRTVPRRLFDRRTNRSALLSSSDSISASASASNTGHDDSPTIFPSANLFSDGRRSSDGRRGAAGDRGDQSHDFGNFGRSTAGNVGKAKRNKFASRQSSTTSTSTSWSSGPYKDVQSSEDSSVSNCSSKEKNKIHTLIESMQFLSQQDGLDANERLYLESIFRKVVNSNTGSTTTKKSNERTSLTSVSTMSSDLLGPSRRNPFQDHNNGSSSGGDLRRRLSKKRSENDTKRRRDLILPEDGDIDSSNSKAPYFRSVSNASADIDFRSSTCSNYTSDSSLRYWPSLDKSGVGHKQASRSSDKRQDQTASKSASKSDKSTRTPNLAMFMKRNSLSQQTTSMDSTASPTDQFGYSSTVPAERLLLGLGFGSTGSLLPERFLRDWYNKMSMAQELETQEEAEQTQNSSSKDDNPGVTQMYKGSNQRPPFLQRHDSHQSFSSSLLDEASNMLPPSGGGPETKIQRLHEYVENSSLDYYSTNDSKEKIIKFANYRQKSLPLYLETLSEEDENRSRVPGVDPFDKEHKLKVFCDEISNSGKSTTSNSEQSIVSSSMSENDSLSSYSDSSWYLHQRKKDKTTSKKAKNTSETMYSLNDNLSPTKSINPEKSNGGKDSLLLHTVQKTSLAQTISKKPGKHNDTKDIQLNENKTNVKLSNSNIQFSNDSLEVADIMNNRYSSSNATRADKANESNVTGVQNIKEIKTVEPAMVSIVLEDVDEGLSSTPTNKIDLKNIESRHLSIPLPSQALSPIPQSPVTVIEVGLDNQQDSLDTEDGTGSSRDTEEDIFIQESNQCQNCGHVTDNQNQDECKKKSSQRRKWQTQHQDTVRRVGSPISAKHPSLDFNNEPINKTINDSITSTSVAIDSNVDIDVKVVEPAKNKENDIELNKLRIEKNDEDLMMKTNVKALSDSLDSYTKSNSTKLCRKTANKSPSPLKNLNLNRQKACDGNHRTLQEDLIMFDENEIPIRRARSPNQSNEERVNSLHQRRLSPALHSPCKYHRFFGCHQHCQYSANHCYHHHICHPHQNKTNSENNAIQQSIPFNTDHHFRHNKPTQGNIFYGIRNCKEASQGSDSAFRSTGKNYNSNINVKGTDSTGIEFNNNIDTHQITNEEKNRIDCDTNLVNDELYISPVINHDFLGVCSNDTSSNLRQSGASPLLFSGDCTRMQGHSLLGDNRHRVYSVSRAVQVNLQRICHQHNNAHHSDIGEFFFAKDQTVQCNLTLKEIIPTTKDGTINQSVQTISTSQSKLSHISTDHLPEQASFEEEPIKETRIEHLHEAPAACKSVNTILCLIGHEHDCFPWEQSKSRTEEIPESRASGRDSKSDYVFDLVDETLHELEKEISAIDNRDKERSNLKTTLKRSIFNVSDAIRAKPKDSRRHSDITVGESATQKPLSYSYEISELKHGLWKPIQSNDESLFSNTSLFSHNCDNQNNIQSRNTENNRDDSKNNDNNRSDEVSKNSNNIKSLANSILIMDIEKEMKEYLNPCSNMYDEKEKGKINLEVNTDNSKVSMSMENSFKGSHSKLSRLKYLANSHDDSYNSLDIETDFMRAGDPLGYDQHDTSSGTGNTNKEIDLNKMIHSRMRPPSRFLRPCLKLYSYSADQSSSDNILTDAEELSAPNISPNRLQLPTVSVKESKVWSSNNTDTSILPELQIKADNNKAILSKMSNWFQKSKLGQFDNIGNNSDKKEHFKPEIVISPLANFQMEFLKVPTSPQSLRSQASYPDSVSKSTDSSKYESLPTTLHSSKDVVDILSATINSKKPSSDSQTNGKGNIRHGKDSIIANMSNDDVIIVNNSVENNSSPNQILNQISTGRVSGKLAQFSIDRYGEPPSEARSLTKSTDDFISSDAIKSESEGSIDRVIDQVTNRTALENISTDNGTIPDLGTNSVKNWYLWQSSYVTEPNIPLNLHSKCNDCMSRQEAVDEGDTVAICSDKSIAGSDIIDDIDETDLILLKSNSLRRDSDSTYSDGVYDLVENLSQSPINFHENLITPQEMIRFSVSPYNQRIDFPSLDSPDAALTQRHVNVKEDTEYYRNQSSYIKVQSMLKHSDTQETDLPPGDTTENWIGVPTISKADLSRDRSCDLYSNTKVSIESKYKKVDTEKDDQGSGDECDREIGLINKQQSNRKQFIRSFGRRHSDRQILSPQNSDKISRNITFDPISIETSENSTNSKQVFSQSELLMETFKSAQLSELMTRKGNASVNRNPSSDSYNYAALNPHHSIQQSNKNKNSNAFVMSVHFDDNENNNCNPHAPFEETNKTENNPINFADDSDITLMDEVEVMALFRNIQNIDSNSLGSSPRFFKLSQITEEETQSEESTHVGSRVALGHFKYQSRPIKDMVFSGDDDISSSDVAIHAKNEITEHCANEKANPVSSREHIRCRSPDHAPRNFNDQIVHSSSGMSNIVETTTSKNETITYDHYQFQNNSTSSSTQKTTINFTVQEGNVKCPSAVGDHEQLERNVSTLTIQVGDYRGKEQDYIGKGEERKQIPDTSNSINQSFPNKQNNETTNVQLHNTQNKITSKHLPYNCQSNEVSVSNNGQPVGHASGDADKYDNILTLSALGRRQRIAVSTMYSRGSEEGPHSVASSVFSSQKSSISDTNQDENELELFNRLQNCGGNTRSRNYLHLLQLHQQEKVQSSGGSDSDSDLTSALQVTSDVDLRERDLAMGRLSNDVFDDDKPNVYSDANLFSHEDMHTQLSSPARDGELQSPKKVEHEFDERELMSVTSTTGHMMDDPILTRKTRMYDNNINAFKSNEKPRVIIQQPSDDIPSSEALGKILPMSIDIQKTKDANDHHLHRSTQNTNNSSLNQCQTSQFTPSNYWSIPTGKDPNGRFWTRRLQRAQFLSPSSAAAMINTNSSDYLTRNSSCHVTNDDGHPELDYLDILSKLNGSARKQKASLLIPPDRHQNRHNILMSPPPVKFIYEIDKSDNNSTGQVTNTTVTDVSTPLHITIESTHCSGGEINQQITEESDILESQNEIMMAVGHRSLHNKNIKRNNSVQGESDALNKLEFPSSYKTKENLENFTMAYHDGRWHTTEKISATYSQSPDSLPERVRIETEMKSSSLQPSNKICAKSSSVASKDSGFESSESPTNQSHTSSRSVSLDRKKTSSTLFLPFECTEDEV